MEYLKKLQKKISAYNHAISLISYDGMTTAPKGTASNRAEAISVLSEEYYKLTSSNDCYEKLCKLEENTDVLSQEERRQVSLLLKDIRRIRKIPLEEYVAYEKLLVEADDIWHKSKEENNFPLFAPYLKKIFDTNIKFAGYIVPEKDPYDYWLNEYEEGISTDVLDIFFEKVRTRLVPLIEKVSKAEKINCDFLYGKFPVAKQEEFSDYLMELIGLDRNHVGISTTEHPFTTNFGSHYDVRITTNYHEETIIPSMYSVIHEGGHALYDSNSREEFAYTVLDGGISMGVHESQSRFYENVIGRSYEFINLVMPKIRELFPEFENVTPRELYCAVNRVEPSLVRIEADEVTYCLHIMVRYELEKKLMHGEIEVHDLPGEWNRLYKEYLGVDVPNDTEGVLQDCHWAGGSIGYFPSYALGSAYGLHFLHKMLETVDFEGSIKEGNFEPINNWNKENIWQHGCLYTPKELFKKATGKEFNPDYYLEYLENKVKDVYGV